ncbi:trace amine-associated receptor 1-like [Pholidichthys leucotaenia]
MPFGLSFAPSCFQKVMSMMLACLKSVVAYLDDIVMYFVLWEQHDERLERVLTILQRHGVTLNGEKCIFAADTVEFVGFWLTGRGLPPLHSNVEAVLRIPDPSTPAQILSFLGMVNFYGRLIPRYSEMIEPLQALLKQDALWELTPACSAAVAKLKQQLTTPSALANFDPNQETIVTCDVSGSALGAAMSQVQDGTERPMAFASRRMMIMEDTELCYPQFLNSSCWRPKRPLSEVLLIYILLSSISLLTIILNLLVIISISHFRQLHTPTNLLLLSLAISDFLVGLLMFCQIVLIDGCWFFGDVMCVAYQYLAFIITSASIGTMVVISVDRYVAICHPLHYSAGITQQRVKMLVCMCWVCSVVFQSLTLKENLKQPGKYHSCMGECAFIIDYIAGLFDLVFTFIAPIAVIVVLYLRVFVVAVSQARTMRSQITATHSGTLKVQKSELKAARTLGVVVIVFLICMCPYYCFALTGQTNFLNVSIFLFYFNSCLNPIIYVFFYPWFRQSIRFIVTLKILQRGSSQTKML